MKKKELLQIKEQLEKQKKEINHQLLELAEKDPRGQNNYEADSPSLGRQKTKMLTKWKISAIFCP